jgi:hypothetical protein
MAIDLTAGTQPAFATNTSVGTTCTVIQAPPGYTVHILADGILYVFNDVADGDAAASAANRLELSATEAAQGLSFVVGGAVGSVSGKSYGTICVAASTGTVTVRAWATPPTRGV